MADRGNTGRIKPVSELRTAADLTNKLNDLKKFRKSHEKDWRLNMAFYRNKQYTFSTKSGRLETLGTEDGDKPRYRVRLQANQITPGTQSLLAKLTKTKPVLSATPQSSSQSDVRAAQTAELLLEDWWVELGLEDKLEEAILWSILGGQGWWKLSWDALAGKPMTFTVNPESGQVVTNDELIGLYKTQLAQMGLPEDYSDQTVFLGDVRVDVLSPFQVWLDPTAKTWTEAKYAICEHSLDPDEIYARFKVRVEPDSVPVDPDRSLPLGGSDTGKDGSQTPSVKKVYFGYFIPQGGLPKGRYVVWVEDKATDNDGSADPKKNILYDGPWPYKVNQLPLVKFPGVRVPGSVYDDSVVTAARPLQKELNRTISQIVEYKNLTIKPRVWAPIGSLKRRLTTEPGAVYEFQPVGGMRPEVEQLPAMPPYVFEHLQDITVRLREVFMLNEVTEGTVPPNVEAGVAIDLLQEMSTDRLAPTIKLIEMALARASKILLTLAQEYYVEPRLLKIRGGGGSTQVKKFKGADIAGGVDVTAESGSGLPRTRAGRQARIESYIDRGILAPQQAWKYLDIADMRSVATKWAADEDQAYRENDKILRGEPINAVEFMMAQQAVQSGVNPETGEPIMDEQEAMDVLERASLKPGPADNDPVHLDVHHEMMVSVEFEQFPPQIQRRFYIHHMMQEEQSRAKAPVPEGQSPRVSLSMHGTLGPTVASKIMQKAGVDASAEEFTEQPLETMVQDFVDQPDAEEAGNDPLVESDLAQRQVKLQGDMARQQLDTAAAVHKMVLAERKANLDEEVKRKAASKPSGGAK